VDFSSPPIFFTAREAGVISFLVMRMVSMERGAEL
jgi:hypothetical protein